MRHRRGFSLIELLVVLTIIGVAIMLFIPAIAGSRQAAQRIKCMNSMRQITLSLMNYHHEFEQFPSGYTARSIPGGAPPDAIWGWAVPMLPHLEASNVWNKIHPLRPVDAGENMTARTARLSTFLCGGTYGAPPGLMLTFPASQKGQPPIQIAPASYVGSFGTRDPLDPKWQGIGDGVFFRNSQIGLMHLSDGISTTFLIGERDWSRSPAAWAGGIGPNAVTMVVGSTGDDDGPNGKPAEPWQFSSTHPDGAHFGFADGSVRFLTNTTSKAIYQALATREGGEAVMTPVE